MHVEQPGGVCVDPVCVQHNAFGWVEQIPAAPRATSPPDGRRLARKSVGPGLESPDLFGVRTSNLSSPGDSAPLHGAKHTVDDKAGDPDGEDADQHDWGVVVVTGVFDQAADAGQPVE